MCVPAVVETIYYVAKKVVDSLVGPNPNLVVKVAACCFLCILACIKGTVEWITEWAFVFVGECVVPTICTVR